MGDREAVANLSDSIVRNVAQKDSNDSVSVGSSDMMIENIEDNHRVDVAAGVRGDARRKDDSRLAHLDVLICLLFKL